MTREELNNLRWMLSPSRYMREKLNFYPDPWQVDVLESNAQQIIINTSRQVGKSTIISSKAHHRAKFYDESMIVIVSPSLRQSSELFKKVKGFHKHSEPDFKLPEDNKLSMTLANGSRIVSLPANADTIRGFSAVDLMIIDEAALTPDLLYKTIRPMLAVSGGQIVLMSTPFGKRGFFHDTWFGGGPSWERYEVKAYDCPRISAEFLEEEKRQMGEMWFAQEYLCEFIENDNALFNFDMVMKSISDEVEPLFEDENYVDDVVPLLIGV